MKQFKVMPEIYILDDFAEFKANFNISDRDLVITSEHIWKNYFSDINQGENIVFIRKYGSGEPTDKMVHDICKDIEGVEYDRVIGIGGGTVLDVAKLFVLKDMVPINKLFYKEKPTIKEKELVLLPTTCGTGSEVTNISILELISDETKLGLAVDELYADSAVLVKEALEGLPFSAFGTSSMDALIHGVESFLSPKATPFSKTFSVKAIEMILDGYMAIAKEGEEKRKDILEQFMLASTYAGIGFGNAGCGTVHAMSYPIGATYHVPHGEANYSVFMEVLNTYKRMAPKGKLEELNKLFATILGCEIDIVYEEVEKLLNNIVPRKRLSEYGMTKEEVKTFTESIIEKQQRLLSNSYVPLSYEDYVGIYKGCL